MNNITKSLLFLIIAAWVGVFAAQVDWSTGKSSSLGDVSNDTVTTSGTWGDTLDGNFVCRRFIKRNSPPFVGTGYVMTATNGCIFDSATILKMPDKLSWANDSLHVDSRVGTVTATGCTLNPTGTTNSYFDDDKGITVARKLVGANAICTFVGGQTTTFSINGSPIQFVDGGTLNILKATTFQRSTSSGAIITVSSGAPTLNLANTASTFTTTTSQTIVIPAINITSTATSGIMRFQPSNVSNVIVDSITGIISGTGYIDIAQPRTAGKNTFKTNGNNLTLKGLTVGSSVTNTPAIFDATGGGIIDINGEVGTYASNIGLCTLKLSSATIYDSTNYRLGTNTVVVPSTSSITFDGVVGTQVIKTPTIASQPFYDVVKTGASAAVCSTSTAYLGDLTVNGGSWTSLDSTYVADDFWLKTGKLFFGGKNWRVGKSFTTAGSDSIGKNTAMSLYFGPQFTTWSHTNSGKVSLDSATIRPEGNLKITSDSALAVKRVVTVPGKLFEFQAGKRLTIRFPDVADFSGDTIKSTSAGVKDTLNILARVAPTTTAYVKDTWVTGDSIICTTCVDLGNNGGNIRFPPAGPSASYTPQVCSTGVAMTQTITNTGEAFDSVVLASAPPYGLSLNKSTGTVSGTPTTSSSKAGYPIAVWFGGSLFSTIYDTLTVILKKPVISYATSPIICTTGTAMSQAITNTGGVFDSVVLSPTLPTGISYSKLTGFISGTPTVASAKTGYKIVAWKEGAKQDSTYDTITVRTRPIIYSIKYPAGRVGTLDTVLGIGFYTSGGSLKIGTKSVTLIKQVDDTLIFETPDTARGTYWFIYNNGVIASRPDSFQYRILARSISGVGP